MLDLFNKHGYKPIEIIEDICQDVSQLSIFKKKVKTADLAQFCRSFLSCWKQEYPLAGALDVLRVQTVNQTKECLDDMYNNIQKV